MRHHRTDEHGQPTDRSLLQDGYDEAPGLSPGLLCTVLLLLTLVVALLYIF